MLRHVIAPSSGWTKAPHTVVRDRRLNSDAKVLLGFGRREGWRWKR
ncbi:hypothetical protein ACIOWM_13195 [Streptomyces anulatus]